MTKARRSYVDERMIEPVEKSLKTLLFGRKKRKTAAKGLAGNGLTQKAGRSLEGERIAPSAQMKR